tara:strand:+ start:4201 stop:4968 length:768 start_codon:yes stop_codon:yes gene_type:complete
MLLTAGCSFVWGDELKGFDENPPTHGPYTFTHLLANKMGIESENRGVCGACNEKIFREVIDYLHKNPNKVTHMVVMWSAWQRAELVEYMPPERDVKIGRQNDVTQFSSLRTEAIYSKEKRKSMEYWYSNAYDSKTDIMHTLSNMKTLEIICDAAGIQLIQGVFHRRNWSNIMDMFNNVSSDKEVTIDDIPDYKRWLLNSLGSLDANSRVGLGRIKDMYTIGVEIGDIKEYGHPGEKTHVIFADYLHETFIKSSQK